MMFRPLSALALFLWCASPVLAQPASAPTTAPASAPASGEVKATITGVEGIVQVRQAEDQPWAKAQVGMVVQTGAEFRTGPRSAVRCVIPPDQTITLDRLGTVKLLQAIREGNTVRTKVGMSYGRTRYDIEEAGVEHRSELVTPSSTLAIRGTRVSVYDQPPFAPSAVSLTGRAVYTTAKQQIAFGAKGQGKTDVSSTADSAAQLSLAQTYVDPASAFGRPAQDQKVINQLPSKAVVAISNGPVVASTTSPNIDRQLVDLLSAQGRFNISLRWTGAGDFDLYVMGTNPATGQPYTLGNPAYKGSVFKDVGLSAEALPVTAATSPDGGRVKFDRTTFAGGGLEFASWGTVKNPFVPQQGYSIAVVYYDERGRVSGYPTRSSFKVDAFLDGKRVPVLVNYDQVARGTATGLIFGPTYSGTASLIPSEKVLTVTPPGKLQGDVRISAVDLAPDATGLDGKPIGNINPPARQQTASPATQRPARRR